MTTSKTLLVCAWIALILTVNGCGSPPRGQAEIGTVLPIRVGIYIDESQTCADPANAGLLSYDGEGLNGAHTHDCRMVVESLQGKLLVYSQQCVDAGIGDGPIISEKGLMTIESDNRFLLHRNAGTTAFTYCDPSALPPGIPAPQSDLRRLLDH
jgi:hypothetical protein